MVKSMEIIAEADMRPQLVAAAGCLLLGLLVLLGLGWGRRRNQRPWLLPTMALIAGVAIGLGCWTLYAFRGVNCANNTERLEVLPTFLWIGAIAGLATALIVAASAFVRPALPENQGERKSGD